MLTFADDRSAFERMRMSQLRAIAKDAEIDVPIEMTASALIPILEGHGVRARPPAAKSRFTTQEDISSAKKEIVEMIEQMRPSELMALAKRYDVEMSIRMPADEMKKAKQELIDKM